MCLALRVKHTLFFSDFKSIKFYKNPFSGRRVVASGPKGGHNEANSPFLQVSLMRQNKQRAHLDSTCTELQHTSPLSCLT
jgi:hypothetical protein